MTRVILAGVVTCACAVGGGATLLRAQRAERAPTSIERIAANDNRTPAGTLANGVLTVKLEARAGRWYPDGEDRPSVMVHAFAATNGQLQVPGPLIRVRTGTEIRVEVRNRLDAPFAMHGLYARPTERASEPTMIPVGERRDFAFIAREPGTYFYWAGAPDETAMTLQTRDTLLSGAIVVDPASGPAPADRVLVIQHWSNAASLVQAFNTPAGRVRFAINGRSWPSTERLSYAVGEDVHLRLINVSGTVHPMHLHGFYFAVDSRGDETRDRMIPSTASHPLVVTERLEPGRTFAMTWRPTRPGNWMFHCHDSAHLNYGGPLDDSVVPPSGHQHVMNHALEMMAGPVMGITVTGKAAKSAARPMARRAIQLVARVDSGSTDTDPAYAYALETRATATAALSPIGPTLLLKRGEPVDVTVVNSLPEDTSVHWHGIELESYFDGVPGFAGEGHHIAPSIPPGGSFIARFTPPRSGTFIYHAHVNDTRQQQAGLVGPLLVVDDPAAFDPSHDIVLMVTAPRKNRQDNVVLVNGSSTPPSRQLRVGEHYRLRLINLHVSRPSMRMRLLHGASILAWRPLAKDGMDLPQDQVLNEPAEIQMGNGETYDFDFVPAEPGDISFDVKTANEVPLATMPIHVVAAAETRR